MSGSSGTSSGSGPGGSRVLDIIARLRRGSPYFNTLQAVTMRVYFQSSPAWPDSSDSMDVRGIQGIQYRLKQGRHLIQEGTTGADGKIEFLVRRGELTLELVNGGRVQTTYQIRNLDAEPDQDMIEGVQRRLRTMGYQLGDEGPTRDGVNGDMNEATDRTLLECLVDLGRDIDGVGSSDFCEALDDAVDAEPGT